MSILAAWQSSDNQLSRQFTFPDFRLAIAFVNKVAELAEAQQHHPDIDIRYNQVLIATTTHDADNMITDKDTQLAEAINQLLIPV